MVMKILHVYILTNCLSSETGLKCNAPTAATKERNRIECSQPWQEQQNQEVGSLDLMLQIQSS